MHMHFGGGDTLIQENRLLLPLYLAHGVTAVRDAAGDLSSTVLAWRDSVARGSLEGPMIFTSGPKIEGKSSIWPGDTEVESQAGVDSALDNLQRLRVDFVKLTDNTLKPNLVLYALGEIRRRGMRSSAHIPASVPVRDAVQLGLGSIEHLSYAIRGAGEGIPKAPGAGDVCLACRATGWLDARRHRETTCELGIQQLEASTTPAIGRDDSGRHRCRIPELVRLSRHWTAR
jgi:hypothetical protein